MSRFVVLFFCIVFYFVSPHWGTALKQKQLTFIKQISVSQTRAELQNEMHLKNNAQFYFITFLFYLFIFFLVGLTDWNEFFSRLSKYKLTINWQIMHINFLTFLLPLKLPSSCCFSSSFSASSCSFFFPKSQLLWVTNLLSEVSFFLYAALEIFLINYFLLFYNV